MSIVSRVAGGQTVAKRRRIEVLPVRELTEWKCPNCYRTNPWDTSKKEITSCKSCGFVVLKDYLREREHSLMFPRTGMHHEGVWVEFHCLECNTFNVRKAAGRNHPNGIVVFPCLECGLNQETRFLQLPRDWQDNYEDEDEDEDDDDDDEAYLDDDDDSGLEESDPEVDLYDILYGEEDEDDDI